MPEESKISPNAPTDSAISYCKLPVIAEKSISDLPKPVKCKQNTQNESVWLENGVVRISRQSTGNDSQRVCSIFPILRINDFKYVYGDGVAEIEDGYRNPWSHSVVVCQPRSNVDAKPHIKWDDAAQKDQNRFVLCGARHNPTKTAQSTPQDQFNVLLLGLDSTSHMAAKRHMKNTMEFIDQWDGSIVMNLLNIVGDGTTDNLMALLIGQLEYELPESRKSRVSAWPNGSTVVDKFPWVWNDFKKVGYRTHYIEDMAAFGTVQYRLVGFGSNQIPTDEFPRPCMLAAAAQPGREYGCINNQPTHHTMLRSLREFFWANLNQPRFSLTFISEVIHEDPRYLVHLDDDVKALLQQIYEEDNRQNPTGLFENTLVILFADHGSRVGPARLSVNGKLEERLPLLAFLPPKRFKQKYAEQLHILRSNKDRLITLFDVHATLHDLLRLEFGTPTPELKHGQSLFTPISEVRSCANASIAPHWCACMEWENCPLPSKADGLFSSSPISDQDKSIYRAAEGFVRHMNERIAQVKQKGITRGGQCQAFKLSELTSVERGNLSSALLHFTKSKDKDGRIPNFSSQSKQFNLFRLRMTMTPGQAQFEATISEDGTPQQHVMDFSRLDAYEPNAWCFPVESWTEYRSQCVCA